VKTEQILERELLELVRAIARYLSMKGGGKMATKKKTVKKTTKKKTTKKTK
jgi:hypothetical protein